MSVSLVLAVKFGCKMWLTMFETIMLCLIKCKPARMSQKIGHCTQVTAKADKGWRYTKPRLQAEKKTSTPWQTVWLHCIQLEGSPSSLYSFCIYGLLIFFCLLSWLSISWALTWLEFQTWDHFNIKICSMKDRMKIELVTYHTLFGNCQISIWYKEIELLIIMRWS